MGEASNQMKGALKITYNDGTDEFWEVAPVGGAADFVDDLRAFLASPNVTLITEREVVIIPSTSIRQIAISRTDELPEQELDAIPGVLVGAKHIVS